LAVQNTIQAVGIVGAGTMGQGIAQVCALSGFQVFLYDIKEEFITKGIGLIEKNLQIGIEKKKITEEQKQACLKKINPCLELSSLKADLIIEAALENLEIKRNIFLQLEEVNSDECILATNTSSIPVTQIASVLKRPERFVGLHFFNPATIMKLVEIISGASTAPEIAGMLKQFSEKLGKISVVAKDSPGFIVNRVARQFYVEALKIVEENVTDLKTVDSLLKANGFKMGPFELMDLIGVDTNFSVTSSMYQSFHYEPRFRPNRIQQQKVDAGHHGKKSGKGFYDYSS
jgi:3-hydroxybutyryl-CoA dehydrogenase